VRQLRTPVIHVGYATLRPAVHSFKCRHFDVAMATAVSSVEANLWLGAWCLMLGSATKAVETWRWAPPHSLLVFLTAAGFAALNESGQLLAPVFDAARSAHPSPQFILLALLPPLSTV
jgi:hypothetical protein